jgi:hypothetical protein
LVTAERKLVVRHWSATNGSGMHHAALACVEAERRLGHDAQLVDVALEATWDAAKRADIHVSHTHFPDVMRQRARRKGQPPRVVFVAHGTPEHVVDSTIEQLSHPGYAPADGWMLLRHWLRVADAIVTFWPRHAAIYRSLGAIERPVFTVPLGVDREFWAAGVDKGKYAGTPSVWTSENQHRIKWVLDVLLAWPWVVAKVPLARLHAHYIPNMLHRVFIDLANSNGAAYTSYLSAATYAHDALRDLWKSFDFVLGLVRYGDHNCLSMQAAATGVATISYAGNEYATHWIAEGDQRTMAEQLVRIFSGKAKARTPLPVPDLADMGAAMVAIYEGVLARPASV